MLVPIVSQLLVCNYQISIWRVRDTKLQKHLCASVGSRYLHHVHLFLPLHAQNKSRTSKRISKKTDVRKLIKFVGPFTPSFKIKQDR